jgi:tricorn protease-like protein
MKTIVFAFMLVALTTSVANAIPETFECRVLTLGELSPDGVFIVDAPYQKEQIGSTFSVDRKSGEMRGGYFLNNRNSKSVRVINEPKTDAFYVISESHGPFVMLSFLYIANQNDGASKSFTYTSSGQYVYTGICQ